MLSGVISMPGWCKSRCVSVAQLPSPGDLLCRLSWWVEMQDHSTCCSIVQTPIGDYLQFNLQVGVIIVLIISIRIGCLIDHKIARPSDYMARQFGL